MLRFLFAGLWRSVPTPLVPSPKAIPAHLTIALVAASEATALLAYFLRRESGEALAGRETGCRLRGQDVGWGVGEGFLNQGTEARE